HSASDKEPMVCLVERHREIGSAGDRPAYKDVGLHQIGHFDLLMIRNVDEDPRSRLLQLKGFRMRVHRDFCDLLPHEVQNRERAACSRSRYFVRQELLSSVADDDMLGSGVVAYVVSV